MCKTTSFLGKIKRELLTLHNVQQYHETCMSEGRNKLW